MKFFNHYNNIVQSAGVIELTGKLSLEGTKEKGIDDYTGTYTPADYENFSDSEYLFGGTSIKREAGKDLSIDCTLEVCGGNCKSIFDSGADEVVACLKQPELIVTQLHFLMAEDVGIECEEFTGNIELNIE